MAAIIYMNLNPRKNYINSLLVKSWIKQSNMNERAGVSNNK